MFSQHKSIRTVPRRWHVCLFGGALVLMAATLCLDNVVAEDSDSPRGPSPAPTKIGISPSTLVGFLPPARAESVDSAELRFPEKKRSAEKKKPARKPNKSPKSKPTKNKSRLMKPVAEKPPTSARTSQTDAKIKEEGKATDSGAAGSEGPQLKAISEKPSAGEPRLSPHGVMIVPGPTTGTAYFGGPTPAPLPVLEACPHLGQPQVETNVVVVNDSGPNVYDGWHPAWGRLRFRSSLFPRGYYVHGLAGPFFRPWGTGYPGAYDTLPPYFGQVVTPRPLLRPQFGY